MPQTLTESGQTTTWNYGPEHDRYKMTTTGRTTWTLNPGLHQGNHYEQTQYASGAAEHRTTLYGAGHPIGEVLTFENPDGTTPPVQTRYFHSDAQGSITAVTDSSGAVLTRYKYDPWGRQTLITGSNTGIAQTRQGHTGHEMLAGGLTHMNGRLYDPVLSRFISADPVVQDLYDLQNLNRYSYVLNNPLYYTDPTGFSAWTKFRDKWLKPAAAIAAAAWVGPAVFETMLPSAVGAAGATGLGMSGSLWAGSAIAGAASGAAVGGIIGGLYNGPQGIAQGAKYGAIGGAISGPVAAMYGGINGHGGSPWGWDRVAAQSVSGGISSVAQGGSFAEGFRMNFATSTARYAYNSFAKYDVSIKPGDGPANPYDGDRRFTYRFENDRIPLNAAGNMPSVMGLNVPLVDTGNAWSDFWSNLGKQGAFPGNVLNYALPVGNAIGVLHDTAWRPYESYFNPLTNWGTMLPAALVTYGAVLDGPTQVLSPHAIDRIRR